jgi:hypothetical protein
MGRKPIPKSGGTVKSTTNLIFNFKMYKYFRHEFNITGKNERIVELPIVLDFYSRCVRNRILEIGNVLSHYQRIQHDVVDKYEVLPGVINEDIVNYCPKTKYEAIISISTLEHIGWDEDPKDTTKILKAIDHIRKLLTPEGRMMITLPFGYNVIMDQMIEEGVIRFKHQRYMKRISQENTWKQVQYKKIRNASYNTPYPYANAVMIANE